MTAHHRTPSAQALQDAVDPRIISAPASSDTIDGIPPDIIASPRSTQDLSQILSTANKHGLSIAPRGGGTQMALGNPIQSLHIIADLSALNRIIQHNAADLTLTVQAGITLTTLRQALAQQGQFLALDAPLPHRATVGGTLAAAVDGPLKWHYGSPRDLVIGMQIAQPDGRLTRSGGQVVKNVSGYDMARLHIGALGTLGIITEVAFKLTPIPPQETTLLAYFSSSQECLTAALAIFNSGVMPLAMTAFNTPVADHTPWYIPSPHTHALAIRLGGRPRTLQRMETETLSIFHSHTTAVHKLQDAVPLWTHITNYGWDSTSSPTPVMSGSASVLPSQTPMLIHSLSDPDNPAAIISQPAYGMINIHWLNQDENLAQTLHSARTAVHNAGGSLIIQNAPPSIKAATDVWDYNGSSIQTMRRLKVQYDPNNILNPNRFAGGI